jgi:hypothetical protein
VLVPLGAWGFKSPLPHVEGTGALSGAPFLLQLKLQPERITHKVCGQTAPAPLRTERYQPATEYMAQALTRGGGPGLGAFRP